MFRHGRSTQPDDIFFEPLPRLPEKRKPLIRLVCPCCGLIVSANALDRAGTTETTCAKCEGTIWIETDDDGAIAGIEGQAKEQKKTFNGDWRVWAAAGAVVFLIILYVLSLRTTPLLSPQSAPSMSPSQIERIPSAD